MRAGTFGFCTEKQGHIIFHAIFVPILMETSANVNIRCDDGLVTVESRFWNMIAEDL